MSVQTAVVCQDPIYGQYVFFSILQIHWAVADVNNQIISVTVWGPDGEQLAFSSNVTANSSLPFQNQSGSVKGTVNFDGTALTVYPMQYSDSGSYPNPFPVVSNVYTCST